ncbi:hypothetical protein [Papillibacter cinnamivorans]|uniref:DUF7973 domain-containing protein n=1 Tax=Papillibacter cinnamivorans DSM 12816 TaxID=1122930 RepID=A0A1W2CBA8_9FIRM|nr:hypothetical protein [Papillibacter cinnamivorans]SMC82555.1 hypothetical protein SAMN02745168_2707 [Papillibacter cinnamivorans DSM 12816]
MNLTALLAAFCGGAFGAAFGGLTAFIFVGIVGIGGVAAGMCGATFNWLGVIPFGSFYGPHIMFAGGVGAAAFARKMGYLEAGKDIFTALVSLKKPVVLVIGGLVGMLGYVLNYGFAAVFPGKVDTVALTVFASAIIAKVIFGDRGLKEVFGETPADIKKIGGRLSVYSTGMWLPYVNTAAEKTMIGLAAGGGSACLTYWMMQDAAAAPYAIYIPFFLSVITLIWVQIGVKIPVTHHISLCASYGLLISGGNLIWGLAGGMIAAFMGDLVAKLFFVYGDCWVDPPATGIAFTSVVLFTVLPLTGVFGLTGAYSYIIPSAILAAAVLYGMVQSAEMKSKKHAEYVKVP